MRRYWVYILASRPDGTVYVGVTGDLVRRLAQHRDGAVGSFTDRYNVRRLVHLEETSDVHAAIAREKQIKSWSRAKKVALIELANPFWDDLVKQHGEIPRSARDDIEERSA